MATAEDVIVELITKTETGAIVWKAVSQNKDTKPTSWTVRCGAVLFQVYESGQVDLNTGSETITAGPNELTAKLVEVVREVAVGRSAEEEEEAWAAAFDWIKRA